MGWVKDAKAALERGVAARVRPRGPSMRGRIEDRQEVVIAPVEPAQVEVDDIVLIRWRGNYILHIVAEATPEALLIRNNVGRVNGWAPRADVLGRVIEIGALAPE